jgi:hypothetical protein
MHSVQYRRPRGAGWRGIAIGAALTAVALGLSVVPSTADGAQLAAQLTNIYSVPETTVPSAGMLIPPSLWGDDDFAGHGPDISTSAELRIGVGGPRNLHVFLCMFAEETREDSTRVGGCEFYLIFQAPPGECVDDVRLAENLPVGTLDELKFRDTNHDPDKFNGQVHESFVRDWEVVGDTAGPEAGKTTGARIVTDRFLVTTIAGDCR